MVRSLPEVSTYNGYPGFRDGVDMSTPHYRIIALILMYCNVRSLRDGLNQVMACQSYNITAAIKVRVILRNNKTRFYVLLNH